MSDNGEGRGKEREAVFSCFRPQALVPGMNSFLKQLEITFRRDPENARPRINKRGSRKVRIEREKEFVQDENTHLNLLGYGTKRSGTFLLLGVVRIVLYVVVEYHSIQCGVMRMFEIVDKMFRLFTEKSDK